MDLESLNLDIIGKLNISFESEDALFDPNEYAVGNVKDEEEFDSDIFEDIFSDCCYIAYGHHIDGHLWLSLKSTHRTFIKYCTID